MTHFCNISCCVFFLKFGTTRYLTAEQWKGRRTFCSHISFTALITSSPGLIPGLAPRMAQMGFHLPHTQQSTYLCHSLLTRDAKGWMETASFLTTENVQPELVASHATEDTRFWSRLLPSGSPLLQYMLWGKDAPKKRQTAALSKMWQTWDSNSLGAKMN